MSPRADEEFVHIVPNKMNLIYIKTCVERFLKFHQNSDKIPSFIQLTIQATFIV
jgi:hypothetical protein